VTAQFFFVLLAEGLSVVFVYLILRHFKKDLRSIGFNKFRPIYLFYALVAYPAYLLLYIVLLAIVQHFTSINLSQAQQIGFTTVHGSYQLIITFLSLVVIPPIAEEILFRGFLFEGLKKAIRPLYAGLLVSAIFAAAHLPEGGSAGPLWIGAIDTFSLSLVLVFLKQRTKSLVPGIFLHASKNAVAFTYLFLLHGR
jgi:membrane protease YdiL (CAAX protease family)